MVEGFKMITQSNCRNVIWAGDMNWSDQECGVPQLPEGYAYVCVYVLVYVYVCVHIHIHTHIYICVYIHT